MKIGILTFHYSRNYGAVLQAFCLKEVLKDMGHNVEVIDYRNPTIEYKKQPFAFIHFRNNPLKYIQQFLNIFVGHQRRVLHFKSFGRKFLNVTKRRFKPLDIERSDYDVIVVGSDQVWNPLLTNGPDPVYYGAYTPKKSILIAYAVSSGSISLLENHEFTAVSAWLKRFDVISVREKRLKDFVESHSDSQAHVVVDPTLLAGKHVFDKITCERIVKEPYILAYSVEGSAQLIPVAKKVAALYHAKVVRVGINSLSSMLGNMKNDITSINASVEQMLSLIKYAECVVALSFHGTVLSLLFEKDFYSVRGNNMARVESVLSKCKLLDRIVDQSNKITLAHIDYSAVRPVLEEMSEDSKDLLCTALNRQNQE